ncbi:hypothetical protein [Schlesneria paludicola]|uniref:hypothetical protein n=1 Tax=Schlesneria paludicola TaxID=360056 RepID=UPI00029B013E|nr:hypothetical protein [Schlesneria paludicola]
MRSLAMHAFRWMTLVVRRFISRSICIPMAVLMIGFAPQTYADSETESELDRVISEHDRGVRAVATYDLRYRMEETVYLVEDPANSEQRKADANQPVRYIPAGPDTPKRTFRSRQWFDRGRVRVESYDGWDGSFGEGQRVLLWDGELQKSFNELKKSAFINANQRNSSITGEPVPFYELFYRAVFGDYTYAEFVRARKSSCTKIDGLYEVIAPPLPEAQDWLSKFTLKVVFDSNRNYLPTRLEFSDIARGNVRPIVQITSEPEEILPGVWAPTQGRLIFPVAQYAPPSPDNGKPYAMFELAVDQERSRFNIPIPEEQFVIDFPVGTLVNDRPHDVTYRVGAETQEGTLGQLISDGRLRVRPGEAPAGPSPRFRYLVLLNIALLVVAGIGIMLNRLFARK